MQLRQTESLTAHNLDWYTKLLQISHVLFSVDVCVPIQTGVQVKEDHNTKLRKQNSGNDNRVELYQPSMQYNKKSGERGTEK